MSGSTFGRFLRVTTAGESHGPANVVIVDGVPAGLALEVATIERELARRRPGQSSLVSQRAESDRPEILSGLYEGVTTGTPIAILVRNEDARPQDYAALADVYRPGHADFTYDRKHGRRDPRGGGRASARETVARVAAGAIARALLGRLGVRIQGFVQQVGDVALEGRDPATVTLAEVEATPVRCPDPEVAARMIALIERVRAEGDSVGGAAVVCATGVPAGWGEPVFDRLDADLAKGLMSLPAVKGVEIGAGFGVVTARGSQNNDVFVARDAAGGPTATNRHGGVLGGISSGAPIVARCAVKPTSSLPREQHTIDRDGQPATIAARGRHDPCVLPRFVPLAEAMTALVLADHALRQAARGVLDAREEPREERGGEERAR